MEKLLDVQNLKPKVALDIDCVGVRGLRFPLILKDKANGEQTCLASADMGVNLPSSMRGTHMSRFVEALEDWHEPLSCQSMRNFLQNIKNKLSANRAWAKFSFTYLVRKSSPADNLSACMAYDCSITGELNGEKQSFLLGLDVPVMTVCPCSKAISMEGAHSQRAIVHMTILIVKFVWLEEFIELAEKSASSPVYTLLKRRDEKFVTELAFSQPAFVEDVARATAKNLMNHPAPLWFEVEVESMESIHNHNAFSRVCSGPYPPSY